MLRFRSPSDESETSSCNSDLEDYTKTDIAFDYYWVTSLEETAGDKYGTSSGVSGLETAGDRYGTSMGVSGHGSIHKLYQKKSK